MFRNAALILTLLSLPLISAWGTSEPQNKTITILPTDCSMLAGEEISLALEGSLPPNAIVSWNVNKGAIVAVQPALNAVFIAPASPALVTITVSISPGLPGMGSLITRECTVNSLKRAPKGMANAFGMEGTGTFMFSLPLTSAPN